MLFSSFFVLEALPSALGFQVLVVFGKLFPEFLRLSSFWAIFWFLRALDYGIFLGGFGVFERFSVLFFVDFVCFFLGCDFLLFFCDFLGSACFSGFPSAAVTKFSASGFPGVISGCFWRFRLFFRWISAVVTKISASGFPGVISSCFWRFRLFLGGFRIGGPNHNF